jgi:thymidine kinase
MDKEMKTIEIYYGPMFGGKSTNLINRYRKSTNSKIIISHIFDTRCAQDKIDTHDGDSIDGIKVKNITDLKDPFLYMYKDAEEVYIDECQFFGEELKEFIDKERYEKKFILAGLDLDSDQKQFGAILDILKMKNVNGHHMHSKCYKCGELAYFTKCIIEKKEQMLIGSSQYKPSCKKCL